MVRRLIDYDPSRGGLGSPQYMAYCEETTYRWSVVCMHCYIQLNSPSGGCEINDKLFTIDARSRQDRASTIGVKDYEKWQKEEATKLGVELSSDDDKGGF